MILLEGFIGGLLLLLVGFALRIERHMTKANLLMEQFGEFKKKAEAAFIKHDKRISTLEHGNPQSQCSML